jgi:hypothetical protein
MTVQANPLRARGSEVALLSDILARGGFALESVPRQIKDLLRSQSWRHFETKLGKDVHHDRFVDFVTTLPLAGLGSTPDTIRRIIGDDMEALDLLDRAVAGRQGERSDLGNNVPEVGRPEGNSKSKALRRLRDHAPDLHAEVLAGNLTAHAAMVKAGFRPHTFTVRPDPVSAARTLRKNMSTEQLAELARLLIGAAE